MIVVHHLGISQSDRIVWLCEELDVPYELKRYERDPATRLAPAAYRALTPFGLEARLAESPYLAGETFTAADIMTLFPLSTMRVFAPRDLKPYSNVRAYLKRIGERPAFQRAMAKADPGFKVPLE
jgi:glutathione S-transferase